MLLGEVYGSQLLQLALPSLLFAVLLLAGSMAGYSVFLAWMLPYCRVFETAACLHGRG